MTERDYAPLSTACVRGLCDKMYEKRKFAGGEIEKYLYFTVPIIFYAYLLQLSLFTRNTMLFQDG